MVGTHILLRSHLPGFPPSVKHEADVNELHQEDAASKDLLVMSLTGSSPGPFASDQDKQRSKRWPVGKKFDAP